MLNTGVPGLKIMTDDKIPKGICLLEVIGIFIIIASVFILGFPLREIQNDINEKETLLSNTMLDLTLSDYCRDRAIMADSTKAIEDFDLLLVTLSSLYTFVASPLVFGGFSKSSIIQNFPESAERNENLRTLEKAKDVSLNRWAQTLDLLRYRII
jgi:hypothetical protein